MKQLGWDDLVCPKCHGTPVDVSTDYFRRSVDVLPLASSSESVQWTCTGGHKMITGCRDRGGDQAFDCMVYGEG